MYYPSSENKGADQLRGYREADLRLCFRICRLLVFPRDGSNIKSCIFKKVNVDLLSSFSLHSVYPSVCRTDGYGTDRRLQEHALFRAKNVLYSFSSKTVRFECIVISALHVHLLSSKTP